MSVGILLLAAGSSRRFGSDKRHAVMADGCTVLARTLSQIQQSGLPLLVCLPATDGATAAQLEGDGVSCCLCENSALGMGATLAEGMGGVVDWRGVVIALADMPFVAADTYNLVASNVTDDGICVPMFRGERGNPVGFGSRFFPGLAELSGDRGGRDLLKRYEQCVLELEVSDPGILEDIDYPGDKR